MKNTGVVFFRASSGSLYEHLLKNIPREEWKYTTSEGLNYMHFACLGKNPKAVKLLIKEGVSIEDDIHGLTPLIITLLNGNQGGIETLELLCAAGASFQCKDAIGRDPLEMTYTLSVDHSRILIANGMRIPRDEIFDVPLELFAFQKGVLKCRMAVVAMIRVKKTAKLWNWDKFLLREIGIAMWATRCDDTWTE